MTTNIDIVRDRYAASAQDCNVEQLISPPYRACAVRR
jgi:hypothetical protein